MSDQSKEWYLPKESREVIRDLFRDLKEDVQIFLFIKGDENNEYEKVTHLFLKDISRIDKRVQLEVIGEDDERWEKYAVEVSPTLLINPKKYTMGFKGAPVGEEGRSLLTAIFMASTNEHELSSASLGYLEKLQTESKIMVFVTPMCPYCPDQVVNAFKAVIARPELVSAYCVEAQENIELSGYYKVGAVPHTILNGERMGKGLMPEEKFMALLSGVEESFGPKEESELVDLLIVGGGPAGLTAAIYSERSGLKSILIEKSNLGGQVATTPVVENYTGLKSVGGKALVEMMATHARQYADIHEGEKVEEIKIGKVIEAHTNRGIYRAKSILIATGALYRKLDIPGERKLLGNGVSFCATCDGFLYKGKKVFVVGGGNSALTEALFLKQLDVDVAIIHRRDSFRGQKHLVENIEKQKIPVMWNSEVVEMIGEERLTSLMIKNIETEKIEELEADGVFVAIGLEPGNELAKQLGLKLDEAGYVVTDNTCRTSIPRVYAAGDLTGGFMQIVTATSEGATAAMSAFEDIQKPYWKEKS